MFRQLVTFNGTLNLANTVNVPFKATGLDFGIFYSAVGDGLRQVTYK